MTNQPIKYAIWSAVSKENQAKPDKVSLTEQVALAHQRAQGKGWQPSGLEYIVPGESRTRYVNLRDAENEIPELKTMLDDAQAGKFDLLILYDYNRLRDLIDPVAKTLAVYGVQLYSVSQPVDPVEPGKYTAYTSDSESIVRGMAQIISRAQISDIQRKNAYAMPKRITERGLPHKVPYGYIHVRHGPALIDPVTSQVVIKAKDMMLAGHSLRQVCNALEAEGHPAPSGKQRWHPESLRDMLSNPYYCGEVTWLRKKVVYDPRTGKRQNIPTPERVISGKGAHVALWTPEEHQRLIIEVQRRKNAYNGKRTLLFTGLLICGTCGGPIRYYNAPRVPDRQYPIIELGSYGCRNNGTKCATITHAKLFSEFITQLRAALETYQPTELNRETIAQTLTAENDKKDRLTAAYLAGAYTLAEYLQYKKPLDETIERLERQRDNLQDLERRHAQQAEQTRYLLTHWDDFTAALQSDEDMHPVNAILSQVIDKILVHKDRVEIVFL